MSLPFSLEKHVMNISQINISLNGRKYFFLALILNICIFFLFAIIYPCYIHLSTSACLFL